MAELKLRSTVDNSGARADMEQLTRMGAGVEKQLGMVMRNIGAAFTVGALAQVGREAVELGSKVSDLATQTGLSMKQFQGMSLAVRDAGANEEQLLQVMAKLRDSQALVIQGNKEAVDSWARLNVSARDVIRSSPAELLELVSQKFTAAGTDGAAFGAVLDIIGARNAPQLTEALQRLATEGFDGLDKSAKAAGQTLEDDVAARLDAFGDMMGRTRRAVVSGVADMFAPVARMLAGLDAFRRGTREVFLEQVEKGGYWDAYFNVDNLREQLRAGQQAGAEFEKSIKPKEDMGGLLSLDELQARDRRVAEANAEAARDAAEASVKADQKAASEVDKLRDKIAALEQKRQFDRLQAAERVLDLERRIAEQRRIAETAPAGETPEPVSVPVEAPAAVKVPVEQPDAVKVPVDAPEPVSVPVETPAPVVLTVEPRLDRAAAEAALKAAQDALRAVPVDAPLKVRTEAETRVQAAAAAIPGAVGEKARLEALEKSLQLQDELDKARAESDRQRWDAEQKLYDLQNRRAAATADKQRQIDDAKAAVVTTALPVDRLASIGGFGVDSASPQLRVAERQVNILDRIADIERRSQQSLERIEQNGGGYV